MKSQRVGHDWMTNTLNKDMKRCLVALIIVLSCCLVRLFATPWTVAHRGSSVHGILQARILEWVAIPFSRRSSQPRDRTQIFHIAGRFFTIWAIREVNVLVGYLCIFVYNLLGKMAVCQGTEGAGLLWMRWQDVLWGMRHWCSWDDDAESTGVSWRQSFCLHHCFFCGILLSKSVLTSPAFSTRNTSLCISRIFSGCCCLWLHSALSFLTESYFIETKHYYRYFWIIKTSSCISLSLPAIFSLPKWRKTDF